MDVMKLKWIKDKRKDLTVPLEAVDFLFQVRELDWYLNLSHGQQGGRGFKVGSPRTSRRGCTAPRIKTVSLETSGRIVI